MMPMAAASLMGKPRRAARLKVKKMPNCAAAPNHELGVGQQRAKVDHRADADEQQQREQLVRDPRVKQYVQDADLLRAVHDLRHRAGQRQIDQDRTEAHRQQQRGLHIPLDRQIDEDPADQPHHRLLPGEIAYI